MERRWLARLFEYATQRESGAHTAAKERPGVEYVSVSIFVARPVATSIIHRLRWLSSRVRRLPSGDHVMAEKKAGPGSAMARGFTRPSWSPIMSWYSPLATESQATCPPLGAHAGPRSCAPELCVRLRESPFSLGTV